MAKITADFYGKALETLKKGKVVKIEAGDETFEVTVKDFLDRDDRIAMFESFMRGFQESSERFQGEDNQKNLEIFLTQLMIKYITDIEISDSFDEGVKQLEVLSGLGILEKVSDEFRPSLVQELTEFLLQALKVWANAVENVVEEGAEPELKVLKEEKEEKKE